MYIPHILVDPTSSPTATTHNPTSQPTFTDSGSVSDPPTASPTFSPMFNNQAINHDTQFDDQQTVFQQLTIIIAAGFLFIILISWIDAKYIRRNDFYQIGPLFSALFHILDAWTDIFFALQCVYHPDFIFGSFASPMFIIFALSLAFIILPMATTLYQLYSVSDKHWSKDDDLRGYLSAYSYSLYMASMVCGSAFASVKLFRSRVFNLAMFDIPLTKQDALHFETKKVLS